MTEQSEGVWSSSQQDWLLTILLNIISSTYKITITLITVYDYCHIFMEKLGTLNVSIINVLRYATN